MSGSNTFGNLLLAALLVVAAVGLYFVIDSHGVAMQQSSRTDKTLQRIADRIDRIESRLASGVGFAPVAVSGAASGDGRRPGEANRFANDNLRDSEAVDGDSCVDYTTALPGQLNEIINSEATVGAIWRQCNSPLASRNNVDLDRFEPVVAESWTLSEDKLTFTIQLKDGFLWQPFTDPDTGKAWDPMPLTARDYTFFWEIIQNPDVPCGPIRTFFEQIQTIEAVDDATLRVVWKEPYAFAESVTLGMTPVPRHLYRPGDEAELDDKTWAERYIASPRNQMVVGVGPYRLAWFDSARGYRLERDERYGGRKPFLKALETRLVGDPEIALTEFKSGRLDRIPLTATQWRDQTPAPEFLVVTPDVKTAVDDSAAFEQAKADGTAPTGHKFEKYQYPSYAWSYIGYNMRRPLFADKRVRQALTLLVDRERMLREVQLGLGQIISGPFVPQNPAYDKTVAPWPYDPVEARKRLAEAGWADTDGDGVLDRMVNGKRERFEFEFIIPSASPNSRKIASIVEQDMKQAGIAVNIKPLEWSVYTELLSNWDFDVCNLAWSGSLTSDPYQIWNSAAADEKRSSNHVGYRSAEADRLMVEARATVDADQRNALFHQFHRVLHEDQPYTFLFAGTVTTAFDKRYRGLKVYPIGMDSDLFWVPETLQKALP